MKTHFLMVVAVVFAASWLVMCAATLVELTKLAPVAKAEEVRPVFYADEIVVTAPALDPAPAPVANR